MLTKIDIIKSLEALVIQKGDTVVVHSSFKSLGGCENGADTVITACPLCLYNLQKNGGSDLPVVYFTELLAEALGVK